MLTPQEWHQRFIQQSTWTEQIRHNLYQQSALTTSRRVLEVGCGSGVISSDIQNSFQGKVVGLDLRLDFLQLASTIRPKGFWLQADVMQMPFQTAAFDSTYCHFFLLWIQNPLQALIEMRRVVRSGGFVVAMAEPDYGGRIDHPSPLSQLGGLQAQALRQQGADPEVGRKLRQLFHQAGFYAIRVGLLGGQWYAPPTPTQLESEWTILRTDLERMISPSQIAEFQHMDTDAWEKGVRILFVPTFYAIGKVP